VKTQTFPRPHEVIQEIPESVGADDKPDEVGGHHGDDVECPAECDEGWVPSFVAERSEDLGEMKTYG